MLRLLPGISSILLPFQSIHLHFCQNLSQFFPALAVANTGSCVGPQSKISHHAGCRFLCWAEPIPSSVSDSPGPRSTTVPTGDTDCCCFVMTVCVRESVVSEQSFPQWPNDPTTTSTAGYPLCAVAERQGVHRKCLPRVVDPFPKALRHKVMIKSWSLGWSRQRVS